MDNQFDCLYEPAGLILLRSLKNNFDDKTIENLINKNCNINSLDDEANTPLHYAVQRTNVDIARLLIQKGANVNAKNVNGFTPLHVAAKYGRINILQEVLNLQQVNKDERNESGETPLYLSLLENRPDKVVSALIDAGCNINLANGLKKETPLHLAVYRESDTIARKLIKAGADMNAKDYQGSTPLHLAVDSGSDEKFVAYLIELANDVNLKDSSHYTPLHYAACYKSMFIAQKLIDKGANLDVINFDKETLLHHAVHMDNLEYLCMLLYYNVPANERNHHGWTPFFKSVRFYHYDPVNGREITRTLINYVTDINQVDEDNITVLHVALLNDCDIALDILEYDANVNHLCKGMHALYFACAYTTSYTVLKMIWQKTDFEIFLNSEVQEKHKGKSFLGIYCQDSKLQDEEFLEFLFTMFDCPYVEDLMQAKRPESMVYCVCFLTDLSYSELPENWLIDKNSCWWSIKTKNPVSLMNRNNMPTNDGNWEKFEIVIEKHCSSINTARYFAEDNQYRNTDNEDHRKGRGKRSKRVSRYILEREQMGNQVER